MNSAGQPQAPRASPYSAAGGVSRCDASGGRAEDRLAEPDAQGCVLAGGQSSRMGRDKAFVEFLGRPLIAHALGILQQAGLQAAIAGATPSACSAFAAFAPVIPDALPGLGPLSGICAALDAATVRHTVFSPVDLPLLPPSLLVVLLRHAQITGSAVVAPTLSGFTQTFPAVIDRAALPVLQRELDRRRCGCYSAFRTAAHELGQTIHNVAVESLVQAGQICHPLSLPPLHWFLNLNTPADLARAEAIQSRR